MSCFSVTIVDSYSEPAYISNERPLDPPIRYLQTRTSSFKTPSRKRLQLFSPPNLILSPSASFMNVLERDQKIDGVLLLLPLPHIPRQPPNTLEPEKVNVSWPEAQLIDLHGAVGSADKWSPALAKNVGRLTSSAKAKRNSETVESMYI